MLSPVLQSDLSTLCYECHLFPLSNGCTQIVIERKVRLVLSGQCWTKI